jgi:hypothetical protein
MPLSSSNFSGIRDNHHRGSVAGFLQEQLKPGADRIADIRRSFDICG